MILLRKISFVAVALSNCFAMEQHIPDSFAEKKWSTFTEFMKIHAKEQKQNVGINDASPNAAINIPLKRILSDEELYKMVIDGEERFDQYDLTNLTVTAQKILAIYDNNPLMEESVDLSCRPLCDAPPQSVLALSKALVRNTVVKSLSLAGNQLQDVGVKMLAQGLLENQTLRDLRLTNNRITDEAMDSLVALIRKNELNTLYIDQNYMTDVIASKIAEALPAAPSLRNLIFYSNHLTEIGTTKLLERKLPIQTIGTGNQLDDYYAQNEYIEPYYLPIFWMSPFNKNFSLKVKGRLNEEKLYNLISSFATKLQDVNVSQCNISYTAKLILSTYFLKPLSPVLNFSNVAMSDACASALGEALSWCKNITMLNITHCGLTPTGAIQLAKGLAKNKSLWKVHIFERTILEEGTIALVKALVKNPILQDIDLWGLINEECAGILAEILTASQTMRRLYIHNCQMTNGSAKELAKGLAKNTSLRELEITTNPALSDDGAIAIVNALTDKPSLHLLNLVGSSISQGTQEFLKAKVSNRVELRF